MATTVCSLCGCGFDLDPPTCGCFEIVEFAVQLKTPNIEQNVDLTLVQKYEGPEAYCSFSGEFAWKCECRFCRSIGALVKWMTQSDDPPTILSIDDLPNMVEAVKTAPLPTFDK